MPIFELEGQKIRTDGIGTEARCDKEMWTVGCSDVYVWNVMSGVSGFS